MEPIEDELAEEGVLELPSEVMRLNMGPSHPAMHGTIRMVLDLDGETVQNLDIQPGYLHRGFEKSCERGNWQQVFPYADRLNYVSPMLNNNGYAAAVEKFLGIKVPERCEYYRVILGELARICDHLTCNGAGAMELGAFTPFLWMLKLRDFIWDILEEETGARMTHSFARIGGMAKPAAENLRRNIEQLDVAAQVLRRWFRHAANAREAVRHARAGLLLKDVPDEVAQLEHPQERRERAQLHRAGAVAGEVVADACQLAQNHAVVLTALRHLDAEELFDRRC